jgi:hypothetical protein
LHAAGGFEVADIERSIKMKRTLIAVLSTVALALAAPSFAASTVQVMEQNSSSPTAAVGGGPLVELPQEVGIPAKGMTVTGVVVMSSPDEIILRTTSGARRFEITPETQMLAGAADGDVVTVLYEPAYGSVRASIVGSAATMTGSRTKVARGALATAPQAPGVSPR